MSTSFAQVVDNSLDETDFNLFESFQRGDCSKHLSSELKALNVQTLDSRSMSVIYTQLDQLSSEVNHMGIHIQVFVVYLYLIYFGYSLFNSLFSKISFLGLCVFVES